MSRTTKAWLLVAAGGIAGATGLVLKSSAPSAPAAAAVATLEGPAGWSLATSNGLLVDLAGADQITYDWLSPPADDDAGAMDLPGDSDDAPSRILFKSSVTVKYYVGGAYAEVTWAGPGDVDGDGSAGTDADIQAFYACLNGNCCPHCSADFNGDGDIGTDADIEALWAAIKGR